MPSPKIDTAYVSSPFYDSDKMSLHRYGNRVITLKLRIKGTSLTDLQTNIRTVQRYLEDARKLQLGWKNKYQNLLYNPSFEIGDPPTGWTLTGIGATVARSSAQYKMGSYSALLTRNGADCSIYQAISTYADYWNKAVTLGCWVYATVANRAILQVLDNISQGNSSYHTGSGSWEWLTATYTLNGAANKLWACLLNITNDTSAYFDGAKLCAGSYCPPTDLPLDSGKLNLELQWGDTEGQSIYFEVIRGELVMPSNLYSIYLWKGFTAIDCELRLECKPFGSYAYQTLAQSTVYNFDYTSSTSHNYKDITTSESYGDVPATLYLKVGQAGTVSTQSTMWIAKRSGQRVNDNLWYEGESEVSTTQVVATFTGSNQPDATCSQGNYYRGRFNPGAVNVTGLVGYTSYTITVPPRGQFRVLARLRSDTFAVGETYRLYYAFGYTYGGTTFTPSWANGDYTYSVQSYDNTWGVTDLGFLILPPIAESDVAGNTTLTLKIYFYVGTALTQSQDNDFDIDYIFLCPIDEGVAIISYVASTDTLALDGITDTAAIYKVNSSDNVTAYPDYAGNVFMLGRDNTRIYFLKNEFPSTTFTVDVTYQPRFLTI